MYSLEIGIMSPKVSYYYRGYTRHARVHAQWPKVVPDERDEEWVLTSDNHTKDKETMTLTSKNIYGLQCYAILVWNAPATFKRSTEMLLGVSLGDGNLSNPDEVIVMFRKQSIVIFLHPFFVDQYTHISK